MTTDMGVEGGISDVCDLVPYFAKHYMDVNIEPMKYMFPLCLWLPGWSHLWSNAVAETMQSLQFFPKLLCQLKAVCNFLKIKFYRKVWHEHATALGHCDARMLKDWSEGFAHWRWTADEIAASLHMNQGAVVLCLLVCVFYECDVCCVRETVVKGLRALSHSVHVAALPAVAQSSRAQTNLRGGGSVCGSGRRRAAVCCWAGFVFK
jgi:hypothetical protein